MCACDMGHTCSRCAGTPFDDRYLEDEPEPLSEPDFAQLVDSHDRMLAPILMLGEAE